MWGPGREKGHLEKTGKIQMKSIFLLIVLLLC